MKTLTQTQVILILRIFNAVENNLPEQKELEEQLLKTGIDYDDVLIDDGDGISIPGYEYYEPSIMDYRILGVS